MALLVPLGGAVLILARGEDALSLEPGMTALGTAGLLLAAAGFYWLNWRCPACKKYLGKELNPSHCPNCRVELRSP
jgi:rubrerythrin